MARAGVIWGENVNEVHAGMGVQPDFSFISPDWKTVLDYIHRATSGADYYFVVNRYARKGINDSEYRYLTDLPDRYEQVECSFRVNGKIPQLWNPQTGEIKPILTYREENGRILVPLYLAPEGSAFVVLTEGAPQRHLTGIEKDGQPLFPGNKLIAGNYPLFDFCRGKDGWLMNSADEGTYTLHWSDGNIQTVNVETAAATMPLEGSWKVHFDPKWGGPELVVMNELKSWTEFEETGIKYYSGTAVYEKTFNLKKKEIKKKRVMLNLGNLKEMAVVTLNGHRFNLSWIPPYEQDITAYLVNGENKLEVEITNLWPNRLIGDGKLPEAQRLTKTNISKFQSADAETLLRISGLLGPVQLKLIEQKKL